MKGRRIIGAVLSLTMLASIVGLTTATPVFAVSNYCQTSALGYNDWATVYLSRPVGYVRTGVYAKLWGPTRLWACLDGPIPDPSFGPSVWVALTNSSAGGASIAQIGVIKCRDWNDGGNRFGYYNTACHDDEPHVFWSVGSDCYSGGVVYPKAVDLGVAATDHAVRYETLWDPPNGRILFKIDGTTVVSVGDFYASCWLNRSDTSQVVSNERWDEGDLAGSALYPLTITDIRAGFYTHGYSIQSGSCVTASDTGNTEPRCSITGSDSANLWDVNS